MASVCLSLFLEAGCKGVLHHLMYLGHFQAISTYHFSKGEITMIFPHICLTSYPWSLISSIFSSMVLNKSSKLFRWWGWHIYPWWSNIDGHAINSPGIRIRCLSLYRFHLLEGADVLSLSLCRCPGDEYAVRYSWLPTPTSRWPSVHIVLEVLVTFRTQETVAVLLHITDVAEVLLVPVQIHGILVTVGGTSYQSCIDVTSFCFL